MKKLKQWAEETGIHYETARRWAVAGKMPIPVTKTETGQWFVQEESSDKDNKGKTVIYARVSSHDQAPDLDAQVGRIMSTHQGPIDEVIREIGSGMNPGRKKINKILSDQTITTIIVENRDRLARMNTELVESALQAQGRNIIYLNDNETGDDMVQDIVDFMTSVCARMYGKRGAKNRAEKALKAAKEG